MDEAEAAGNVIAAVLLVLAGIGIANLLAIAIRAWDRFFDGD